MLDELTQWDESPPVVPSLRSRWRQWRYTVATRWRVQWQKWQDRRQGNLYTVRLMERRDLAAVQALEKRSGYRDGYERDAFFSILDNPARFLALVVVDSRYSEVAGYLFGTFPPAYPDLSDVCSLVTAPEHRRCGVARKLLSLFLRLGSYRGIRRTTLQVRPSNVAAQRLYRQCGFRVFGTATAYFDSEDAWIMVRENDPPSRSRLLPRSVMYS